MVAIEMKKVRLAVYARVSKDEADSSGRLQDPTNQLIPLRKFAEAMNWEIREEFVDRASGGDSARPEFQRLLGLVRQGHVNLILVWSLDRFSREGIVNTMSYIKQLRKNNCAMKSLKESWLDTREEGISDLMLSIMAWAAAEERKKIAERTKAGLVRARKKGKILGRHPKDCQCPKHRQKNVEKSELNPPLNSL